MSDERDLSAEAAAAFYRDWRFQQEIEEERRRDFVRVLLQQRGVRMPASGDYPR